MIIIVGKGIFGLSVAEFLSRDNQTKVRVLSERNSVSASRAAAANLATKAQVFARETHFALKLAAKKIYRQWLQDLCRESSQHKNVDLNSVYVDGLGRDVFATFEQAERQWRRVKQSTIEIAERQLPPQALFRTAANTIEYGNEAWVDAKFLLNLLEDVCCTRGVEFYECDATNLLALASYSGDAHAMVLCAGSATLNLLETWNINELPAPLRKSRRWSYGATLFFSAPHIQFPRGVALFECVSDAVPEKLTFSGSGERFFCSSVSVSCSNPRNPNQPLEPDFQHLARQQPVVASAMKKFFSLELAGLNHTWSWGKRLGFGHQELVVECVSHNFSFFAGPLVVASGAHKSGFLFAPMIGALVRQKLQA